MRNLILGDDKFVESYPEYRQILLSGEFAFIAIVALSVCSVIDLFIGNYSAVLVFGLSVLALTFSIFFHRVGNHKLGHYFLFGPINITAYLLASSEDPSTGAFIHFLSIILAEFMVFGYRHRKYSLISAGITIALFFLAYSVDFSFLPRRHYNEDTMMYVRLLNFITATIACSVGVFKLIRMNYRSAKKVAENYELLSKANKELDRFVYSTSHDLRAPLTSLLGLINIADLSGNQDDIKRYHAMMKDRVSLLDKFIKDITDYSRNNRLEVERNNVNLSRISNEVWDLLKYTPEAQQVNFQIDFPDNIEIVSDERRLKIVLLNLVSNAIRYQDSRKPDPFVKLHCHKNGRGYHINVEDNGQGIHPEHHVKVFDMFFRGHENSKGSGLGLYIVKETITKLSGSIQLESTPGVGSTFTVKLPYSN